MEPAASARHAGPDPAFPPIGQTGPVVDRVLLTGRAVRLEPLSEHHVDALVAAAAESRAPYAYAMVPDGRPAMAAYVAAALSQLEAGRQLPFATVLLDPEGASAGPAPSGTSAGPAGSGGDDAQASPGGAVPSGRVVGSTRFDDLAIWTWPAGNPAQRTVVPDAVEIGGTWLAQSARRTVVNTEAKLLMLSHAFDVWNVYRVRLRTDVRNQVSWKAIERIGARFEGVLRADRPGADGTVRDSALFSIVADEWPAVRERLTGILDRPR